MISLKNKKSECHARSVNFTDFVSQTFEISYVY